MGRAWPIRSTTGGWTTSPSGRASTRRWRDGEADFTAEQGKNLAALDTAQADFYNRSFTDEANRRANLRLGHVANEVNAAGIFGPALASTDLAIGAAQQQAGANTINTGLGAIQGLGQIFSPGR